MLKNKKLKYLNYLFFAFALTAGLSFFSHAKAAENTSSFGSQYCEIRSGNSMQVCGTYYHWTSYDDSVYSQMFKGTINNEWFSYNRFGSHFGAGRVRVTVCMAQTRMWERADDCWVIIPDQDLPDNVGVLSANRYDFNIHDPDTNYNDYNYMIVEIGATSAGINVPGGTVSSRRVSLNSFTVDPPLILNNGLADTSRSTVKVGEPFTVSWDITDAFNRNLSYMLPGNNTWTPVDIGESGSQTFTASSAGTATFILSASGPGRNGLTAPASNMDNPADPDQPGNVVVTVNGLSPGAFNLNSASCSGNGRFDLSWGASSNVDHYEVYKHAWSTGSWSLLAGNVHSTSYTTYESADTDWYFYVKAVNNTGYYDSNIRSDRCSSPPGFVNLNYIVKNNCSNPISGALVTIDQNFGNGTTRTTDGSGFATFGVYKNKTIGWSVSASGYSTRNGSVNSGGSDQTVNVTLSGSCGPPTEPANISVSSNIPSSWRVCGSVCYDGSGTSSYNSDVFVGQYVINQIPTSVSWGGKLWGLISPSNGSAQNFAAGETKGWAIAYGVLQGTLNVFSRDNLGNDLSSSWTIAPGVGSRSGTSSSDVVTPDSYTISPSSKAGYTVSVSPNPATVNANNTTTANIIYTAVPLNAPTLFTPLDNTVCKRVTLSWQDNSNNEKNFKVYRDGSVIATLPANSTTYQDRPPGLETSYTYYVAAWTDVPYSRESASSSSSILNRDCIANISNSTKVLTSPELNLIKDGDTVVFLITISNGNVATAAADIQYITDTWTDNVSNMHVASVSGLSCTPNISRCLSGNRINVTGQVAPGTNATISLQGTLVTNKKDPLETLSNSANIYYYDVNGNGVLKNIIRTAGPYLVKTNSPSAPSFREVAP